MIDERVSGNIWAEPDDTAYDGEAYFVRGRTGMGWNLPTKDLEPIDLRALADRIEARRGAPTDALLREITGLRAQCAALREREAHLMRELDEVRAQRDAVRAIDDYYRDRNNSGLAALAK